MKYFLGVLVIVLLLLGLEWIITCGFIKLITLCFGLSFSWSVATGIWLVLMLMQWFLKNNNKNGGK